VSIDATLRPDIASSWRRAMAGGLDPGADVDPGDAAPVDSEGRLLRAAGPVLDELAEMLDGSRYTVLLADRDARLVGMRFGRPSLRSALEGVGAVAGKQFTESTTGTNSIATAFELRRGVAVHGEEHYLESFKRFACYGVPISDPATRRLAGVLDITCLAADATELLRPFLVRASRDIEARLLGDMRRAHRRVLDAFEVAAMRSAQPLVAFGDDLVLSNDAAANLLQPADHAALETLAAELATTRQRRMRCELELASGGCAAVALSVVDGGVLVSFAPPERAMPVPRHRGVLPDTAVADWHGPLQDEVDRCIARGASVVVLGEPGTGRRSMALRLAGPAIEIDGATAGAADLAAAGIGRAGTRDHANSHDTVLVTDAHLLRGDAAAVLVRLAERHRPRLVLTAVGEATGHWAEVAALCPVRLTVPALRSRRDRIPAVAAAMLGAATEGRARFTPQALRALAALDWPGNLRELRTVIDDVAGRRSAGDVTEADLPAGYRGGGRPLLDGALWQAERHAVVDALRSCAGNKVHAARMLGISRNTLYRRLRVLRIDPDALVS
jgi:sigma-54 dependent transcriptional regulator, acetoin dehydrogenase operon transcriptional activator AcoR